MKLYPVIVEKITLISLTVDAASKKNIDIEMDSKVASIQIGNYIISIGLSVS
jgi:hypothetical protein